MIQNMKRKPNKIRSCYIDIMLDIWNQHGENKFHSSDLCGIDYQELKKLVSGDYVRKIGTEPYGKFRKVTNIYQINPCYVNDCKKMNYD